MTTDQIDKIVNDFHHDNERVETTYGDWQLFLLDIRTEINRLVRMAVEADREECAKVADEHIKQVDDYHHTYQSGIVVAAGNIAAAIRNRKERP